MALSSRDLDQIRRIIREEIERARRRHASAAAPIGDPQGYDDEADPARRAAAEIGRSTVRAARDEPGAAEQLLRQQAAFYGQYDPGWCRRARRKLGMTGDEPLQIDDALRALRLMKRRKSPR